MVHVQAQKNTSYYTCVITAAATATCLREGQVPQCEQPAGTDCQLTTLVDDVVNTADRRFRGNIL